MTCITEYKTDRVHREPFKMKLLLLVCACALVASGPTARKKEDSKRFIGSVGDFISSAVETVRHEVVHAAHSVVDAAETAVDV